MFLKLHGVMSNEKILINTNYIEAIQEITEGSKYYSTYGQAGAKTVIRVGGKTLPVKESVRQIENRFNGPVPKVMIGGADV